MDDKPDAYAWSWRDYADTKKEDEEVKVTKVKEAKRPKALSARPKVRRPAVFSRG